MVYSRGSYKYSSGTKDFASQQVLLESTRTALQAASKQGPNVFTGNIWAAAWLAAVRPQWLLLAFELQTWHWPCRPCADLEGSPGYERGRGRSGLSAAQGVEFGNSQANKNKYPSNSQNICNHLKVTDSSNAWFFFQLQKNHNGSYHKVAVVQFNL